MSSSGGIIIQRTVIAGAITNAAIYEVLPAWMQEHVEAILAKPVADWTACETAYIASAIQFAVYQSETHT
jgi:hypothetical protein